MELFYFVGGSQDGKSVEFPNDPPPHLIMVDVYETIPVGIPRCPPSISRFLHREFYDREPIWDGGRVIGHVFKFASCNRCGGRHVIHTPIGAHQSLN